MKSSEMITATEKETMAWVTYQKTSIKCVAALNQMLQTICKGTQNRKHEDATAGIHSKHEHLVPSSQNAVTEKNIERGCVLGQFD